MTVNSDKKLQKSFLNFKKALLSLEEAFATPVVTKRDIAGVIQHFEFTYELAWKTLKHFLAFKSIQASFPSEVLEKSFQVQLIEDPLLWGRIVDARNLSVHTYNEELAKDLVGQIERDYLPAFKNLFKNLNSKIS